MPGVPRERPTAAGPPSLTSRICETGRWPPPGVAGRVDAQLGVVTGPWQADVVATAWRPPGPWSLCVRLLTTCLGLWNLQKHGRCIHT